MRRARLSLATTLLALLAVLAGRVPHARANSGPCAYQLSTDAATDAVSGVKWQRAAPSGVYSLTQAQMYCQNLLLDGTGSGYWRLPTIRELQTIVHEGVHNPAIDTTAFTDKSTAFFWSSTPLAAPSGSNWGVYFDLGNVGTAPVGEFHAVRCAH